MHHSVSKSLSDVLSRLRPLEGPYEEHSPDTLMIACVDSRKQLKHMCGFSPNEVLVHKSIAALVAPYDAETEGGDLGALLSFGLGIKGIEKIILMVHTECGGATLASLDPAKDGPAERRVRRFIAASGLNVPNLRERFNEAADPDFLARTLGIQSLKNLFAYPCGSEEVTVENRIRNGTLEVALICYDMKGKIYSVYDLEAGQYRPVEEFDPERGHFCRKSACPTCCCDKKFTAALHNAAPENL